MKHTVASMEYDAIKLDVVAVGHDSALKRWNEIVCKGKLKGNVVVHVVCTPFVQDCDLQPGPLPTTICALVAVVQLEPTLVTATVAGGAVAERSQQILSDELVTNAQANALLLQKILMAGFLPTAIGFNTRLGFVLHAPVDGQLETPLVASRNPVPTPAALPTGTVPTATK